MCGTIRYRTGAEPLYDPTLCHCRSCQRAAGAHAVAWFTVPLAALRYERGSPAWIASSPGVKREFCASCGSPLTYWNQMRATEVDITICSLDIPGAVIPTDHIWTADAVTWEAVLPGLPRWGKARGTP